MPRHAHVVSHCHPGYYSLIAGLGDIVIYSSDPGLDMSNEPGLRNLDRMKNTMLLIQYIAAQFDVPDEVVERITIVKQDLDKLFMAMEDGKAS